MSLVCIILYCTYVLDKLAAAAVLSPTQKTPVFPDLKGMDGFLPSRSIISGHGRLFLEWFWIGLDWIEDHGDSTCLTDLT